MNQIKASGNSILELGRQGENLARQVVFDLSAWEAEYGPGTVELIHQRPGDTSPYPVAAVREGSTLVWALTATDTAVASSYGIDGRCELRWYVGETLVKSKTWRTRVDYALSTPSETAPPEPEQGWVDQIISVGAAAKASADAAKADADRAAALAAQAAEKAAQTAQDASDAEQAKEAAQTAQRLAEAAKQAAETAKQAAETAQSAAAQSATDAATAKQGAEAALKSAQDAAAAAAKALADIRALYQEMQTWAQGVIQDVNAAGSAAVQSVQSAGDTQVQRVTDEGTTQTANAKAQADAAAQSAAGAAQSAQEAAESAAVYDDVVADVNQLKQDLTGLQTVVDSKADKTELAKTNLYLDALYKLNKGQTYDVLEQESEAYSVDVPSGAKYVGIDKVGGKSVVWNQLINGDGHSGNVTYDDGRFIVSNFSGVDSATLNDYINLIKGHKYFIESSSELNNCLFYIYTRDYKTGLVSMGGVGSDSFLVSKIVECSATNIYKMYLNRYGAAEDTPATNYNGYFNLFDLTVMFGVGNEPSTVEEFEAMFPADYYPYSDPTIISSQTDRVDVRGKNLLQTTAKSKTENGLTWTVNEDGTITVTGTPTNYTDLKVGQVYVNGINANVTISKIDNTPNVVWGSINLLDNTGKLLYKVTNGGPYPKFTVNLANYPTADHIGIYIKRQENNIKTNTTVKIQVELGTTATDWTPYSLQQITTGFPILNSAGSVYDYIDLNEGKLYTWTYIDGNEIKALTEPVITDITIPTELTDWLTVEAGGSITFHNTDDGKRLLIPNKLSFVRKLDEVTV